MKKIQILDDIELEGVVGGAKKTLKKKVMKKKVSSTSSLAIKGNAVTVPKTAV